LRAVQLSASVCTDHYLEELLVPPKVLSSDHTAPQTRKLLIFIVTAMAMNILLTSARNER
jgi:hypothetical protein